VPRKSPGGSRMTGRQRREQLLDIGRELFAERGYEATSVEEVAARAGVSKPVVYEHFKGKDGLYALVVDRELSRLGARLEAALDDGHPRRLLEQAADAFLGYIEDETDGFRVLVRDSPMASASGGLASLIGDVAGQVEHIFAEQFRANGFDPKLAPIYSRALTGMVALVGEWWLESRKPSRDKVAAHLVNLAWNGLRNLERQPRVSTRRRRPAAVTRSVPTT
jgi:AcrR family transcriptional regulator